ncbi:MAG: hypothetical protein JW854_13245 [Actinobacteria bacterium]|nr:hypothetical protein [Actinomycetota bacterium]
MPSTCKTCGFPRLLSMTQAWRDGCIVDNTSGSASLCIYEASYPTALINELEDRLGIPLERIVYLAGTHAAVKVLGVLYESHPHVSKLLFSAPFHGLTERMLVGFGRAIGVANVNIVERKRRKETRVIIENPFDLSNCLAIISGILQIADGCNIAYNVLEGNGAYLVEFTPTPSDMHEEEAYQRLFAENLAPRLVDHAAMLSKCQACGAPREAGELCEFDIERGLISERGSGDRMIMMGVHGYNSIIRELSWELGDFVYDVFIDFEKKNLSAKLAGSAEDNLPWGEEKLRQYFALRGLGMLDNFVEKNGTTSITVHNAFIAPLVAGRLLALWELVNGREGSYSFDVTDNLLNFSIS